jgi:rhomboid protease GluP
LEHSEFTIKRQPSYLIWIGFATLYTLTIISLIIDNSAILRDSIWNLIILSLILITPYLFFAYKLNFFRKPYIFKIYLTENLIQYINISLNKIMQEIDLTQLTAMDIRGSGKHQFCTIQAKTKTLIFTQYEFDSQIEWENFIKILKECIEQALNHSFRDKIQKQMLISQRIFQSKHYLTNIICGFITLIFIIQCTSKTLFAHWLIAAGAANSELFFSGDYFRLLSAGILHSGYLHFIANISVLFVLLLIFEGLIGASFAFSLYLLTQFFGLLICLIFGQEIIVGTSAGVYGLIGCYLYLCLNKSQYLPAGLHLNKRTWFIFLSSNLLLVYLFPKVSFLAHFSGFALGYILSSYILKDFDFVKKCFNQKSSKELYLLHLLKYSLISLLILLSGQYFLYLTNPNHIYLHNYYVLNKILTKNLDSANNLNIFAWDIAIDKKITKASKLLDLANLASTRALNLSNPNRDEYLNFKDTLATTLYRNGDYTDAIIYESEVLRDINKRLYSDTDKGGTYTKDSFAVDIYLSQLYRFIKELPHELIAFTKDNSLKFGFRTDEQIGKSIIYIYFQDQLNDQKYVTELFFDKDSVLQSEKLDVIIKKHVPQNSKFLKAFIIQEQPHDNPTFHKVFVNKKSTTYKLDAEVEKYPEPVV